MSNKITSCKITALFLLAVSFISPAAYSQNSDAELDRITIKGEGRAPTTIEQAGTVTTVTAQDIEDRNSKILKDTLTQIPGIQVTTQRKGTRTFSLRGYGMDKVAILVDGVPVIDAYSGSMDIDNIGLLDVSEIIISRGTSSALYGTKGSAGFINIIKSPPTKPYVKLNAEVDHLGNHFFSAAHGARFGDFYYMLSASFDKSYGYEISKRLDYNRRVSWLKKLANLDMYGITINQIETNGVYRVAKYYLHDRGKWDHVNHTKYKTNFKIGYKFTDTMEGGVTGFYNHSRMQNSYYNPDMRNFWRWNFAGYNQWYPPFDSYSVRNMANRWPNYDDWSVSPYFNYTGDKVSVKSNFYYYGQNNKYAVFSGPDEFDLSGSTESRDLAWSIWENQTFGFTVMPSWRISQAHELNFSLNWYYSGHIEREEPYDERSTNIIATAQKVGSNKYKTMDIQASFLTIAAEYVWHHNLFDLSAGVSYDAQDLNTFKKLTYSNYSMIDVYKVKDDSLFYGTRDSFNPVVGIVSKKIKDLIEARASISYKTSFPTLQAYSRVESNKDFEGTINTDTKIKPEKSLNGNIGGELSFLGGSLTVSLDWFYSYYQDKIIRFFQTRINDYVYRNVSGAYLTGTETAIAYHVYDLFNMLDLSAGVTHTLCVSRNLARVHNSNINKGKYFEYQPVHKFTVDFRAMLPKWGTGLFIFGYLEYDQIYYTMKYNAAASPLGASDPELRRWRTDCFKPTQLNNPLMIDVKLSQKFRFLEDYEVEAYIMCKNIFDDYLADPFNPGPGRTWCFGAKANWN